MLAKKFPTALAHQVIHRTRYPGTMRTEHHYRWRCRNPWGKAFTTRFTCTWETISAENPEAVAIEGSLIVRHVPDTPEEIALNERAITAAHLAEGSRYQPRE